MCSGDGGGGGTHVCKSKSTPAMLGVLNTNVQSGQQVSPSAQVAPPTCQNLILIISQRPLKLETLYLVYVLHGHCILQNSENMVR